MKEKLLKVEAAIAGLPQKIKALYHNFIDELHVIREKMRDLGATNYELGLFHMDKGNIADAKMRFIFTIKLKKDFALAHYHLARCYLFNLNFDKAKHELKAAIDLDPSLDAAQYRLKLIDHNFKGQTIPIEVTKEDYNCLAYKYEDVVLQQLHYLAPELLAKAIATYFKEQNIDTAELKCLDLGCGTGLAGNSLAQEMAIKSLLGIDISIKMLELAKTLEINDTFLYTEMKE